MAVSSNRDTGQRHPVAYAIERERRVQLKSSISGKRRQSMKKLAERQNKRTREIAFAKRTGQSLENLEPIEEPIDDITIGRRLTVDNDAEAASSFTPINHDFLFPFDFGGSGGGGPNAIISNLLHLFQSDNISFIPPVIALIMDNASTNKSIHMLRAFGLLLERVPIIQEVHLYFPTVGHTHNSVDAHFGHLCQEIKKKDIATPSGLN